MQLLLSNAFIFQLLYNVNNKYEKEEKHVNFAIALLSSLSFIFFIGMGIGIFQFREQLKKQDELEEMLDLYE